MLSEMLGDRMTYTPRPIDTSTVELTEALLQLTERLSEHAHEVWAKQRLADGWTWGPRRDDLTKCHPNLVPYDQLPDPEKQYDRNAAMESIKALLALGYRVVKA
jgi:ryanodine receptor 2